MFKKILIAEDSDFVLRAMKEITNELGIEKVDSTRYCDNALNKIIKANRLGENYGLLISDLSFLNNDTEIEGGIGLITKAKQIQPNLKIIVFSVEDKSYTLNLLLNELKVDAFVWKSIYGEEELKRAIRAVYNDENFFSPEIKKKIKESSYFEITQFDQLLLGSLADGMEQREFSDYLKDKNIKPNSVSSIEKRLKLLKENLNVVNLTQLIAVAKDFGFI